MQAWCKTIVEKELPQSFEFYLNVKPKKQQRKDMIQRKFENYFSDFRQEFKTQSIYGVGSRAERWVRNGK